jgi:hypothetical protein
MNTKLITGAIALASLAGCAPSNYLQAPLATTYEHSTQQKMQAAHHWDVLAEDVASRLSTHFTTASVANRAISVVPSENSPFEEGFEDLLITQMVNNGLDIRANGSGNLKLSFDTQVVNHGDRGYMAPPRGTYTKLAVIGTGIWALVNIADNSNRLKDFLIGAVTIGAGVSADAVAGRLTGITNQEVIINVSLMDGDKYLMRKSGIYYIDATHYDTVAKAKSISVVAD